MIGGSAGIGLETARLARSEGGEVVLTGRDPERLEQAARELPARSSAAFDADDAAAVKRFFDELRAPIDHVLIAAYTRRSSGPMLESRPEEVGQGVGRRVTQVLEIARNAAPKMRAGGTLLLTGGSERSFDRAAGITPAAFAVLPPFTAQLALELAPVRVNLIQAGFVDTALATSYFADDGAVEARREELRATLPIGRVVGPADVAALAVHLMTNTAITGATYDIDGGQRLISLTRRVAAVRLPERAMAVRDARATHRAARPTRPPRRAIGPPPLIQVAGRDIRSSPRGLSAGCGWRQSATGRTCARTSVEGTTPRCRRAITPTPVAPRTAPHRPPATRRRPARAASTSRTRCSSTGSSASSQARPLRWSSSRTASCWTSSAFRSQTCGRAGFGWCKSTTQRNGEARPRLPVPVRRGSRGLSHDAVATRGVRESAVAGPYLRASIALTLLVNAFSSLLLATVLKRSARNRPLRFLPSRTTW